MKDLAKILFNTKSTAEQRIQAIFQLMLNNTEEAANVISKVLRNDPSPIVRHECAYSLGEMDSQFAKSSLVNAIQTDNNPFVVHEAALALATCGEQTDKVFLKPLLQHENTDVVLTAKIALQRLDMTEDKFKTIETAIRSILSDNSSEESRIQASFYLMHHGSERAIDTLLKALKREKDPIVKHEIIFALGETAATKTVEDLIHEMENECNLFVLHETLLALGTLGDENALPAMQKMLYHPEPDIVESAEIAIERLLDE